MSQITHSTSVTLTAIAQYIFAELNSRLAGKVDTVSGKGLSTEDFTTAFKEKLENINLDNLLTAQDKAKIHEHANKSVIDTITQAAIDAWTAAQANVIESIKINGTAQTPDANKAVDITVPTNVSDLTNDSLFQTQAQVTAAIAAAVDALTAGENITIETVNGELTISATDTDTWVPNSSGAAGYVASGEGQANKAWMTDENGNPAWRAASAPTDAQVQTAVYRYLENENLEEMVQTSGGAMTPDIKRALLDAFAHVAWADANGLTYYNTLETALFPNLDLVSISAVYTQTKPIYTDNSLDDLRSELVVTANYSNSSSEVVSFYTLTGTLNAGTRAITVTYGGKTATFQVVVTPENVWISALGNGGHSAQPAYSPFVLPSSTYQYDYSKEITAIELNVITAGQLSIGYCTRSTLSGTYSYSDSVFVTHEVLSTVKAGTQKIRLQTPLTIPSGYTLFFGVPTDTMDFDYGGTFTNGFYYHNLSNDKWAVQNRTIGMNIYTA